MQLHRETGCGFKEKVYQDAFEVLLKENRIEVGSINTFIEKPYGVFVVVR